MVAHLGARSLSDGEPVELVRVSAPAGEWTPRVSRLLGHKGPPWTWQNDRLLVGVAGVEALYYLLCRDDTPFSNIMIARAGLVGLLAHVWTCPQDRRKGASRLLLDIAVAEFFAGGGEALYLGTEPDTPPFHFYRRCGFTPVEVGSGYMVRHRDRNRFLENVFRTSSPDSLPLGWRHWVTSAPLMLEDWPGRIRCAALGMIGPTSPEAPFLRLLSEGEPGKSSEGHRFRVRENGEGTAVVALAGAGPHPLWNRATLVDVYAHPAHWEQAATPLAEVLSSASSEYLAYSEPGLSPKEVLLAAAGFIRGETIVRPLGPVGAPGGPVYVWRRSHG